MSQHAETLTQLLRERVGDGRPYTYRSFGERAVDPETDYRPSRNTLHKIVHGQSVIISPRLVRALAAGMALPLRRVQDAAARQYIGYQADDPLGESGTTGDDEVVRVAHRPGIEDLPAAQRFIAESRAGE